jgi:hypothetical protein
MEAEMTENIDFDLSAAHKHFSVHCFNRAWDLIDKPHRTPEEDAEMLHLSVASLWHWTQRADCTKTNLSVSYWQVSRAYALVGRAEEARRYGQLCLDVSQGDEVLPFYRGYAYEALARAESVAGNAEKRAAYVAAARQEAAIMSDPEAQQLLLDDLATIG